MNIAYQAMLFAREVHKDQVRKYTGNAYTDHLGEVAGIVASVEHTKEMIAVAWLHDCVEDQGVEIVTLVSEFGMEVAKGVLLLSDLEQGNRATRKALSRERLSKAPGWVQTIKYADLISNTSSIIQHDAKFAQVYLEEKRLLLEVMDKGDPLLYSLAKDLSTQGLPNKL